MKVNPTARNAEQALLGGLISEPRRIGEVIPLVAPSDFLAPEHEALYRLILALHRESAVDLVTVTDRMVALGPERFGGVGYVVDLPTHCPSAAALGHYATIVRDTAIRRRLMALGAELTDRASSSLDVADILRSASEALASAQAGTVAVHLLDDVLDEVVDHVQAVSEGRTAPGLSTGFVALDVQLGGGFRPGELTILAARPAMGKAQPLNEPVMTPYGPMSMGSIGPGDLVIGRDGKPRRVLAVWPQGRKPVHRVTFSDGTSTRCCAEHLWTVTTRNGRRSGAGEEVVSLASMIGNLRCGGHWNYQLPIAAPVDLEATEPLPLDPWLLGVLLGDGNLNGACPRLTNSEPDIQERVRALLPDGDELINAGRQNEWRIRGRSTRRILDAMGLRCLSAEKHVPDAYLMASIPDRIALLQGLCDTDGYVTGAGGILSWGSVSPRLRDAFVWLVQSLGGRVSVKVTQPRYTYRGERRSGQPFYRCNAWFDGGVVPVSSAKHLARWTGDATVSLRVIDIAADGEEECRCLTVEGGEYLTRGFVVTHNTALAMNIAVRVARDACVGVFSMEMPRQQLVTRLLPMVSEVPLDRVIRATLLTTDEWERIGDGRDALRGMQLLIDDTPGLAVGQLAVRARAMAARGAELIVIDYLGKLRVEGRNLAQEVGRNVSALKDLARELKIPVVCLAQLNRGVEQRADKRPGMADLRDSGEVEQEADSVLFVYRPHYYDENEPESELQILVGKARMGRLGTVVLHWDGALQTVTDCAPTLREVRRG